MNRIKFFVTVPIRYTQKDFMDMILKMKKESELMVRGSALSLNVTQKTLTFERFNKKFSMDLFIMGGDAAIDITEV